MFDKDLGSLGKESICRLHRILNLFKILFSEPFLEALPQVHILIILYQFDAEIIGGDNFASMGLFLLALVSSMFTVSFGIAKFLKTGPCRLLPEEGLGGGFMHMGFVVTFLNVATMILCKANQLVFMVATSYEFRYVLFWGASHRNDIKMAIITWFMICYLPNLIHVCICFIFFAWVKFEEF